MVSSTQTPTTLETEVARWPLDPRQIAIDLSSGILATMLSLGIDLSLAALIFSGPLAGFTANELQERVRRRALVADLPALRFVLLDFRLVPRVDSTALLSFTRLLQLAEARGLTLIFTQLAPEVERQIMAGLLSSPQGAHARIFPSLDHGLEWCENELLAASPPLPAESHDLLGPGLAALLAAFEQRTFAPGEYLIRQGDQPEDMFFIEVGQIMAQIESPDGPPARLESMRGGRMVGELGFLLGSRRTAAVVADEPSRVRRITRHSLEQLRQEQPALADAFHQLAARLLSERVVHLITTVDALQR